MECGDELQYSDTASAREANVDLPNGNDLDEDSDLPVAGAEWRDLVLLVGGWLVEQCAETVVYA